MYFYVSDECQTVDLYAEWLCRSWGIVLQSYHRCCLTSCHEWSWTGSPYCFVNSNVSPNPSFCLFDYPSTSTSSTSSWPEDCDSSLDSFSSTLSSPLAKTCFIYEPNPESKWCFPRAVPPPTPLPDWKPLP